MEIVLGKKHELDVNKTILIFLVEPGETSSRRDYQFGTYRKWLDCGELKYSDGYVKEWKHIVDWVSKTENARFVINSGLFCRYPVAEEIVKYCLDTLPKYKYRLFPNTDNTALLKQVQALLPENKSDVLLFCCGEFALGCVTQTLIYLKKVFQIPKKNVFLAHNFSVTPIPADSKYHKKYLEEIGCGFHQEFDKGRTNPFNTIQSVYLDLDNNSFKKYKVKK